MMRTLLAGLLAVTSLRTAYAGPVVQSEHAADQFGAAVAIDGDRLAVGTPGANAGGVDAGLVYVFEREADGWRRDARVEPDEPVAYGRFGAFLALRGDVLAVAAPVDASVGAETLRGACYVFERADGEWQQRGKFQLHDVDADTFGVGAALAGERAAFTAVERRRGGELLGGVVMIAVRDGDEWREESLLEREDADRFGFGVAMDDDHLVVTDAGGQAFAYRREGAAWVGGEPLAVAELAYFTLARLSGATLMLAGGGDSVQFHVRSGAQWRLEQTLELGDGGLIGYDALALHGERAAIGVHEGEDRVESIVILERAEGAWVEAARVPSPHAENSAFGRALALSDDRLAVSTPDLAEVEFVPIGEVRVYAAPAWAEEAVLEPGEAEVEGAGCGCQSGAAPPGWLAGVVVVLLRRRRR